ncbi:MAG: carboxypeptidase regulatory-like domain-containing protein [Caldilineaceae bacterium]
MLTPTVGSLSGTVTDEDENPLTPVAVALYSNVTTNTGKSSWVRQYTGGTHADGAYVFDAVKPGKYRIRFSYSGEPRLYGAEYYNDAATIEGAQDVTVESGGQFAHLDAKLARTGSIAGHVTDRNGQPLTGIKVSAYRYATDNANNVLWPREEKTFSDASGAYQLAYLDAGRYRLLFEYTQWPPHYLSAYYADAKTLDAATDITVTPGAAVAGIDAQLDQSGHITGKVTDEANRALTGIRVIVYRYSVDKKGVGQRYYYQETTTTTGGLYDLGNLPPDNYRLRFLDGVKPARYQPEYYNNEADVGKATALLMQPNEIIANLDAALGFYGSGGNTAPVAVNDDVFHVKRGQPGQPVIVTGNVLTNDSDPDGDAVTVELVTAPLDGVLNLQPDGAFQYQPNDDTVTSDSFTYLIRDGANESNIATVTITLMAASDGATELFLPVIMR